MRVAVIGTATPNMGNATGARLTAAPLEPAVRKVIAGLDELLEEYYQLVDSEMGRVYVLKEK